MPHPDSGRLFLCPVKIFFGKGLHSNTYCTTFVSHNETNNAMTTQTTPALYVITNDRYSNQPDEVTFEQLSEMCQENGFDTNLRVRGGKIYDSRGEVVAEQAHAE